MYVALIVLASLMSPQNKPATDLGLLKRDEYHIYVGKPDEPKVGTGTKTCDLSELYFDYINLQEKKPQEVLPGPTTYTPDKESGADLSKIDVLKSQDKVASLEFRLKEQGEKIADFESKFKDLEKKSAATEAMVTRMYYILYPASIVIMIALWLFLVFRKKT